MKCSRFRSEAGWYRLQLIKWKTPEAYIHILFRIPKISIFTRFLWKIPKKTIDYSNLQIAKVSYIWYHFLSLSHCHSTSNDKRFAGFYWMSSWYDSNEIACLIIYCTKQSWFFLQYTFQFIWIRCTSASNSEYIEKSFIDTIRVRSITWNEENFITREKIKSSIFVVDELLKIKCFNHKIFDIDDSIYCVPSIKYTFRRQRAPHVT